MAMIDPQAPVPPFIPPAAQAIINRFELVEQPQPNPQPRQGERATHTAATRLWTGSARGVDDGHEWMEHVAELGWRVSREVMEQLDAEGRLIFPSSPEGRIARKHYLSEQEGRGWTASSVLPEFRSL